MDREQFAILDKKINALIGLLIINFTKEGTLQDRVELLYSFGLPQTDIAKILGKSYGNIAKNLDRIRKKKKKKKDDD